ncbi:AtpZ/AtpI family protein [Sphingomonas sp. GlSt437]|uniref:AtpZ/AtpI family protein n=1 Tax=Sphingomonas sp. GlSt437 TaxID=3389970 RepID=UPI003A84660F
MGFALADDRQNGSDDLSARIARAKAAAERPAVGDKIAETRGWSVAIEFVGMVLVSAAIGYGIDTYAGLGTKPFALIGMLLLGFAGAVYRAIQESPQFDVDSGNEKD